MVGNSSISETVPASCCGPARPRDRIVTSARDLFHRHGIRGVGVEAIAEAAGTNKMTLYRHFGCKDDLIVECLQAVADEGLAMWVEIEAGHPGDHRAQLQAWVQQAANWLSADGRGCDLANAAMELTEAGHPARRLIEKCKRAHRDRLVDVCKAAGITQADLLADTLVLLLEGARVSRQSVGAEGPSAKFVRMSEAVIEAFAERGDGQRAATQD